MLGTNEISAPGGPLPDPRPEPPAAAVRLPGRVHFILLSSVGR